MARVTRQYMIENHYDSVIKHAQKFLDKNFVNKVVSYTVRRYDKIETISILFNKSHFSHLIGLRYRDMPAIRFWNDFQNDTVDWNKISFTNDADGKINAKKYFEMKMLALESIDALITKNAKISDGCLFSTSYADKILRTKEDILGIGLKLLENDKHVMFTSRLLSANKENIKSGSVVILINAYDKSTNQTINYYKR